MRRRWDRLRGLWRRALEENASPKKFAFAVAVGAFLSAAPLYGARTVLAAFFGWCLELNKLTTMLASHLVSGPFAFFAIVYQVKLGCLVLAHPVPVFAGGFGAILLAARSALLAWIVGALLVAPPFALLAGLIAYPIATRFRARKLRRLAQANASATPQK